eukprot:246502-Pelagomonas_calceolata.AAC.3
MSGARGLGVKRQLSRCPVAGVVPLHSEGRKGAPVRIDRNKGKNSWGKPDGNRAEDTEVQNISSLTGQHLVACIKTQISLEGKGLAAW